MATAKKQTDETSDDPFAGVSDNHRRFLTDPDYTWRDFLADETEANPS